MSHQQDFPVGEEAGKFAVSLLQNIPPQNISK